MKEGNCTGEVSVYMTFHLRDSVVYKGQGYEELEHSVFVFLV